jgi:hypothetical protein
MRLKDSQAERLARTARRMGRTPSETAALLLEEALRQDEFALIEFRDSPVGRQAYLKGSRLTLWQIVEFADQIDRDVQRIADLLEIPPAAVHAAINYAESYPEEIAFAIQDNHKSVDELRRLIPGLHVSTIAQTAS